MKKKEAFKVIQDKAIPKDKRGAGVGNTRFPFDTMKVNSYFVCENKGVTQVGNNRAKKLGRPERFTLRTIDGEMRCYRIK